MKMNKKTNENHSSETRELIIIGLKRLWQIMRNNWQWKVFSVLLAVIVWGWLISENPDLTREKTFSGVNISVIGEASLKRKGLIVTDLEENLSEINISAEVPQKVYDSALPSNYNVRIDLSQIDSAGEQTVPVLYTNSANYGKVIKLSKNEIALNAEPYITRRRIPVQINQTGVAPNGFYASKPTVDPSFVTIAGPKSLVENVVRCVANYNLSLLTAAARNQFTAVSFTLYDYLDKPLNSELIEVSSDSIPLDTLLVEQELYRLQAISINKSGIITGSPAYGYEVTDIKIDPSMLNVAGSSELMETLKLLDVEAPVDITGAKDTLIRSVAIKKPEEALHMSENAVYVTVTIEPVDKEVSSK
jgi:YbbR domain-containing protein